MCGDKTEKLLADVFSETGGRAGTGQPSCVYGILLISVRIPRNT